MRRRRLARPGHRLGLGQRRRGGREGMGCGKNAEPRTVDLVQLLRPRMHVNEFFAIARNGEQRIALRRHLGEAAAHQQQEVGVFHALEQLGVGADAEIAGETASIRRRAGVELHWRVQGPLPTLYVDSSKVKVIVKNLVGNASKFTERGSIVVSAHASGGGLRRAVPCAEIRPRVGVPRQSLL